MSTPSDLNPKRRVYIPAVGPRLRWLLASVLGLFAILAVNGGYLVTLRVAGWWSGQTYENYFSLLMFLAHLLLGIALILPLVVFGVLHIRNAHDRKNRRAVRVGYALFATSLVLVGSGIVLTRIEGLVELKNPHLRSVAYWAHVLTPIVAAWLFVLHRLAGPRIRWRVGGVWAAFGTAFALILLLLHAQDPRQWNQVGPASGEQYFFPSLARTATGNFISASVLDNDEYCQECHADAHAAWSASVHRFSSFNNPAYLFSVRETRKVALERDGDLQASRFCAGCHDPVVFFSGAFDDPNFDDVAHPTATAGITCTSCHAITHINSPRGNADFTIEEPIHYPFAFSRNPVLAWVNRQLVKAKPEFHRKTFLKPLHQTADFCGSCHKVHLPEELNHYKWLRGQNHYDSHLLSGVSGKGVSSFYYPPKANPDCNGCHMPLRTSADFGADYNDDSGKLTIHDHQFPSANTAIPHLLGLPSWVNERHREFLEGCARVDIFGVKLGGTIAGALVAPLRPEVPALVPGQTYLIETVVRTLRLGHLLTEGTADSNELWLDVKVTSGDRVIGRSGGREADGTVDPWSHFLNAYVLDRDGNRIDRRNAQDIFVPLYNHQIPPGAADVSHFELRVPTDLQLPVTVEVKLQYRKFDTRYMQYVYGPDFVNDLPITTIATDRVTFPLAGVAGSLAPPPEVKIPTWERWNDYGIGLLRKADANAAKGELRQAEAAFAEVEKLGRPDGPLNRARVYIREGRLADAAAALEAAARHDPPAYPWSVAWFTGLVNRQTGHFDEAIENFRTLEDTRFQEARERGFDFGSDYRLLNELGQTLFERAKLERGEPGRDARTLFLTEARRRFDRVLELDPENATAHYNLSLILPQLGDDARAAEHQRLHAKYKPDDNARDVAIAKQRAANPAANHAAEAVVIYSLQRVGAPELDGNPPRSNGAGR
ncbi:MAG: tetratricopeptide repeat protein [Planctomycetota bacterium]